MTKPKSKQSSGKRKSGHFFARKDEAVKWFQRDGFEPSEFLDLVQSERELVQAQHDLSQLNDYCKQEVQKVVHAHHKDFLEASRDIQELEAVIDELRNYVSGSAAVVANLVDLPAPTQQSASVARASALAPSAADGAQGQPQMPNAWKSVLALQAELMQELQVAVAEQDFSLARALLSAGRDMIAIVERDQAQLSSQVQGDGVSAWRYSFEGALAAQKAELVGALQNQLAQSSISVQERRQAAQTLSLLVGPSQAAQALLRCHSMLVRAAQQQLLKQHSAAGGDPDGVEYAGGLAQRTFLAIGAAAEDVRAIFPAATASASSPLSMDGLGGKSSGSSSTPAATTGDLRGAVDSPVAAVLPTVSALLVQWAADEARQCAGLLCRHALMPFTATGMAVGALLCVGLAVVFCVALESTHGLALRMVFQEELWPLLDAIIRRHLHRLQEEAVATTSVDVTNAALQSVTGSGAVPPPGLSAASGGAAGLPRNAIALLGLVKDGGGGQGSGQVAATYLLPAFQLPTHAPTASSGLASLRVLVPELRSLAEGLAPLSSLAAVAVLRQGVLSVYGALCSTVHSSVARLAANIGSGGKEAEKAANGPLLAAYVAKVEGQLRKFAESDVQVALAPLSTLAGSVAPPDMLLPYLTPLTDLLASLPPPAPERTPAATTATTTTGPDPSSQQLIGQAASTGGLMERIRAELEAEQERLDRDREGRRIRDMPSSLPSIESTASAVSATAVTATTATAAGAAPTPREEGRGALGAAQVGRTGTKIGQQKGEVGGVRKQISGGEAGIEPMEGPSKPTVEPPGGLREGGGRSAIQLGDRGNGQQKDGQYGRQQRVFAAAGAAAIGIPPEEVLVAGGGMSEDVETAEMLRSRRQAGLQQTTNSYKVSSDENEERTRGADARHRPPPRNRGQEDSTHDHVVPQPGPPDTTAVRWQDAVGPTGGRRDRANSPERSLRTKDPVPKQPVEERSRKHAGLSKGNQGPPDAGLEGGEEDWDGQVGRVPSNRHSSAGGRRFRQPSPSESPSEGGSDGEAPSSLRERLVRRRDSRAAAAAAAAATVAAPKEGAVQKAPRADAGAGAAAAASIASPPDVGLQAQRPRGRPQGADVGAAGAATTGDSPEGRAGPGSGGVQPPPRGTLRKPPRSDQVVTAGLGRVGEEALFGSQTEKTSGTSRDSRRGAPQPQATAAAQRQQRVVDSSPDRPPPAAPSAAVRPAVATTRSGGVASGGSTGDLPAAAQKSTLDAGNVVTAAGGVRKANRFGVVISDDEDDPEPRSRVPRRSRGSSLATGGPLSSNMSTAVAALGADNDRIRSAASGALVPGLRSDELKEAVAGAAGRSTDRRPRVPRQDSDVGEAPSRPTKPEAPNMPGPSRSGGGPGVSTDSGPAAAPSAKVLTARERLAARMAAKEAQL